MIRGIQRIVPDAQTEIVLLADGGDGTLDAFAAVLPAARLIRIPTFDPMGREIEAPYLISGSTAVVETALASGLALVPPEDRNIWKADSEGAGMLIRAAAESAKKEGITEIIIGLGGSATNDCGAGLLRALGAIMLDANGRKTGRGAEGLRSLASLDLAPALQLLSGIHLRVMCDVQNPLTGSSGASRIYGPQKGAGKDDLQQLDELLGRTGILLEKASGQSIVRAPGSGAAGGCAGALLSLGARLEPGFQILAELTGLREKIRRSDIVFTGEGRFDSQSKEGKAPQGVLTMAREEGRPCFVFAGMVEGSDGYAVPIVPGPVSLADAIVNAAVNLENAAARICAALKAGQGTARPSQPESRS